jgi:hypothetical protein
MYRRQPSTCTASADGKRAHDGQHLLTARILDKPGNQRRDVRAGSARSEHQLQQPTAGGLPVIRDSTRTIID